MLFPVTFVFFYSLVKRERKKRKGNYRDYAILGEWQSVPIRLIENPKWPNGAIMIDTNRCKRLELVPMARSTGILGVIYFLDIKSMLMPEKGDLLYHFDLF